MLRAQHFSRTPTGQYKAGCKDKLTRGCCGCGPIVNATPMSALNAAVSARMRALGVPVLPLFDATLPLWKEHVARRSDFVQREHILDCTHWCEPNSLFAAMTPALLKMRRAMCSI